MEEMLKQLGEALGFEQLRREIREMRQLLEEQRGGTQTFQLNQKDAAKYLGYESAESMRTMRRNGGGPKYHIIGKKIFYYIDDLREWALNHPTFENTSQEREYLRGE
jgi:hypothetical protein